VTELADELATWPVEHAAAAVIGAGGVVETAGDVERVSRIASVTKPLVAYAALVAVEEGTLDLDAPAGPPGSTVRHLLAHASGLPFEGDTPIAPVGVRRIYSNTGFDAFAAALAAGTAMSVARYLSEAVLSPLGMTSSELRGSASKDVHSCVADLGRFAAELLSPTLIDPATLAAAVTRQIGVLPGVVPDVGRFDDNAWGLGFELRDAKVPHWMPPAASPATFGHFGATGAFLWVDPVAALACVCTTERQFGRWALEHWPRLGELIFSAYTHR
jgi:CubicO group peptidase (beta-lactamase class C family)